MLTAQIQSLEAWSDRHRYAHIQNLRESQQLTQQHRKSLLFCLHDKYQTADLSAQQQRMAQRKLRSLLAQLANTADSADPQVRALADLYVSEEEALKFVTLNPAKLLRIDNRVGSIKPGKDADLVMWSDHPLSSYAIAQQTYIDGICYFDIDRDAQLRLEIASERKRIMSKMQAATRKGGPAKSPSFQQKKIFHCMEDDDEIH